MVNMKIIKRGAEAVLYLENNYLVKERVKKGYRIEEIDNILRKSRTKREARLLSEARRLGVKTPRIFSVNDFKISMEFVEGKRLKEFLNEVDEKNKKEVAEKVGRSVGILHENGIVHGDLTTSNMILKGNEIYFIDFGLGFFSNRLEDLATDLSVLKEAFKSTHFKYLDLLWKNFLRGYKKTCKKWKRILEVLERIEKRGRYIKR
jgi:Kae1-associated kinase Bud32